MEFTFASPEVSFNSEIKLVTVNLLPRLISIKLTFAPYSQIATFESKLWLLSFRV